MINNSDICMFLIFLFQICRVCYAKCSGYENLVCCPDTFWNIDKNRCDTCPAGYLGVNCSTTCSPPSYGKDCQFSCSCRPSEECHWLHGCVETQTEGTTPRQTTMLTTVKDTETTTVVGTHPSFSTRMTSELYFNIAMTSKGYTSARMHKYSDANTLQNNAIIPDSPILLGIFVVLGLFLVLFAVFVGTQIRHKCFQNNTSQTQSMYGYNPHLKSYDLITTDTPPDARNMSQVKVITQPDQSDPHYIEIESESLPNKQNIATIKIHLQGEEALRTQDGTLPKYIEVIGSPKNSTSDNEPINPLPPCGSNAYMSECTHPKQMYLSAV